MTQNGAPKRKPNKQLVFSTIPVIRLQICEEIVMVSGAVTKAEKELTNYILNIKKRIKSSTDLR